MTVEPATTHDPQASPRTLPPDAAAAPPMRVGLAYDMDACQNPTGVTRHALAQIERLRARPDIDLRLVSGWINVPDGLAYWESLGDLKRRQLPIGTRNALRWWRLRPWPPIEWWTGAVDWVYCPAEYGVPTRQARRAITCHDILQDLQFRSTRKREWLGRLFNQVELILSVSHFNTGQLLNAFPGCAGRVEYVPNAADDLFFSPATERERAAVRNDLGLPPGMPYLLSVANFQPRKNLVRLVRAAARVAEVRDGQLAVVLMGSGSDDEERTLREELARLDRRVVARLPGYRQERALRAAYAEATALVFPSLCESFGIPAVEAMAQGVPVALADSTALPEIAGEAGWYFPPENEDALTAALTELLTRHDERARRVALGRARAEHYRWQTANDRLVDALQRHRLRPPLPRH